MNRNRLLIGISAAAFAAGMAAVPAGAQTNNVSTGNCTATAPTSPGGTCVVDNNVSGNDNNRATVTQIGEGNFAQIIQRGDDNVAAIEQNGEANDSRIRQDGDDHFAFSRQVGSFNGSTIRQGDDQNSASVLQNGDDNQSTVNQGVLSTGVGAGNTNAGEDNVVSVSQNGSDLVSVIDQRRADELIGPGFELGGYSGFDGPADDNSATVIQTGTGSSSEIVQFSRGNIARVRLGEGGVDGTNTSTGNPIVRQNESDITQYNQFYTVAPNGTLRAQGRDPGQPHPGPSPTNNPRSDNVADVAIIGVGNSSSVTQNGILNRADVSMLGGGAGNTGDTTANVATNRGPAGRQLEANARAGNRSNIQQQGRGNRAAVSLGGLGGQGNQSQILQGVFVELSQYREGELARDHTAFAWQRGILEDLLIIQDNNLFGPGNTVPQTNGVDQTNGAPGNGAAQGGSYADVSQRSLNSDVFVQQWGTNSATVSQGLGTSTGDNVVLIQQRDAGDVPNTAGGGIFDDPATSFTVARNTVAVSQTGIGNVMTIDQDAINANAIAWQQNGSRNNNIEIEQGTPAGSGDANMADVAGPIGTEGGFLANPGDPDTPPGGTFAPAAPAGTAGADEQTGAVNLTADVTQAGRGSRARVRQAGQDLSALVTQNGTATNAAGAAINSNNFVGVSQINALNSATVSQSGFGLSATVDQRGSGEIGTDNVLRRNLVTVQQTGDSHRAIARQTVNVGPSGPNNTANTAAPAAGDASQPTVFTFARAAGRQSAEIQIIQTGSTNTTNASALDDTGNDAFVEQQGRGQFARIEQNGAGNDAGILQGPNATNAVAVIQQNGNGNRFFITQDTAGQYMHIRQTGNNNASTTEVSSAPTTGQTGGTGSPTNPGFFPF